MLEGKKIREFRNKKGWSLRELERRTGIGKSLIADIENNKANPTLKTLERLAEALGVDIQDFFDEGK